MTNNASNSYAIRINMPQHGSAFSDVLAIINRLEGRVGAIDIVKIEQGIITRDIIFDTQSEKQAQLISEEVGKIIDVIVRHLTDRTFMLHLGGKIEIKSKISLNHRDDLSMVYTPGVARVCMAIHESPEKAFNLTIKKNMVAVVSDGTAVLGLGDIGPLAAMPVMEGKAMLFKKFADVDAFPVCLATKDVEEIIQTVKNIAPSFGAINLEDISAPRCFEIEDRLRAELDIPVFHDDQHGTSVVVLAALINALQIVGKRLSDVKIVINGMGAAGISTSRLLLVAGAR